MSSSRSEAGWRSAIESTVKKGVRSADRKNQDFVLRPEEATIDCACRCGCVHFRKNHPEP
jgi:hypothetical protein